MNNKSFRTAFTILLALATVGNMTEQGSCHFIWLAKSKETGRTMIVDATDTEKNSEVAVANDSDTTTELKLKTPFPKIPVGITSFGGAVVADHLYVYGGHCGNAHEYYDSGQNGQLYRLNVKDAKKWEAVCQSDGLQGLAMVTHGGNLYRVGGFEARNVKGDKQDLHSVSEFARFDFESKTWQKLKPMPVPRSSLDAVVVNDTLFVVGGWTLKGAGNTVWCDNAVSIDLSNKDAQWQAVEVPFKRRALSVGFQNGSLYAIGGMRQKGGPTSEVKVFDLKTKTWSDGPKLPGSSQMEGFGNSCFNVGGRLIVSTYSGEVLRLNESQDAWEKIYQLETGRFFHRLLPISDKQFMLVGGANMDTGKVLDVEVLSFN